MSEFVRLGDVATFVRGITFKPDDITPVGAIGSVACLRTKNIQASLDLTDVWAVPAGFVKRPDQVLVEGDVLVSSANSWNLVGKCSRVPRLPWTATFGGFVSALRSASGRLDPAYLYRWFSSPRVQATVRSFGQQTTNISNLNIGRCLDMELLLPPLPEQRRIAAILDKADELRAKRRAALAKLDTLTQSIFLEMFGDPVRNDRQWPIKRLSEVGSIERGVSKHRPRNAPELLGGPYPFVQTGDVTNSGGYVSRASSTYSEAGLRQSRLWPAGTLCVTIAANIAHAGILAMDACFPDSVVGFRTPDSSTVEYVRVWLSFLRKTLEDSAPSFAQKNINLDTLRNLPIPVPPPERQRSFAAAMSALQSQRALQGSSVPTLDLVFASLQHWAFDSDSVKTLS